MMSARPGRHKCFMRQMAERHCSAPKLCGCALQNAYVARIALRRRSGLGRCHRRFSIPAWPRYEHGYATLIIAIAGTNLCHQVTFLQLQRDQDVASVGDREEEMPRSHRRGGPERDDEAKHERVAHQPVQNECAESEVCIWSATPGEIHLTETEEVEVIDHECCRQCDRPAEPKQSM